MGAMKTDDRPLIETRIHKEDELDRWLYGEKSWMTRITIIVFTTALCLAGVAFKDIRLAVIAGYSIYLFSNVLEWTRAFKIRHAQKNDFEIMACLVVVPSSLALILIGATDKNMAEGLAWQACGIIMLYAFATFKLHTSLEA